MDLNDYLAIDEDIPDSSEHDEQRSQRQESQSSDPPNPTPKEKASAGRIIRRRARKACVECHKRKVRCDVLTRGQVCTNCRLDGQPCIIRSNDGRRKQQNPPQPGREAEPETPQLPAQNPVKNFPSGIISVPMNQSEDINRNSFPTPWPFAAPAKPDQPSVVTSHFDMIFSYYGFLEADTLSHIAPEDFKFLEHKGCFHVPSRPILNDFVRHYFLHVHPALPILDEREFWELYLGDQQVHRKPKKLSLFLFRAMLFATCSFVSMETIKLMGFQDAMEARTCFYRRAKLLFDFNALSDNISNSQGALLLTYYSSDREGLANTSWLRVAIQLAMAENVHLYDQKSNHTLQERNARKRLWWCCILRDRILPLGVRRSIQITRDNFDFNQEPLVEDNLAGEFNYSTVYDYETKRALAMILLAQMDLAVVLTDVLSLIYPIKTLDYSTLMEMPTLMQSSRDGLHSWNSHLEDTAALFGSSNDSVTLFHGLTQIYYHSALAAICQYEALALHASNTTETSSKTKDLGSELHSAIAANKVDDWLGVFVSQPRAYLRIALTIDISLCKGRYAETEDFPKLLLVDEKAGSSIPRGLDPVSSLVELDDPGDALEAGNDRRDLDYFDFGLDGKSPVLGRADVNPWQGQTVDDILGNVLQGAYAPTF